MVAVVAVVVGSCNRFLQLSGLMISESGDMIEALSVQKTLNKTQRPAQLALKLIETEEK